MGLDCFWRKPDVNNMEANDELDAQPVFDPPLDVAGYTPGKGEFRGKAYANYIKHATGVSLYRSEISNKVVCRMADALDRYTPPVGLDDMHDELRRMFRAYAAAGAVLISWW